MGKAGQITEAHAFSDLGERQRFILQQLIGLVASHFCKQPPVGDAEGNFVLTVSEGEFAGKHTSFYDLFRVEAGKIVEHWDTIEAIPPKAEWQNTNGKFGF